MRFVRPPKVSLRGMLMHVACHLVPCVPSCTLLHSRDARGHFHKKCEEIVDSRMLGMLGMLAVSFLHLCILVLWSL